VRIALSLAMLLSSLKFDYSGAFNFVAEDFIQFVHLHFNLSQEHLKLRQNVDTCGRNGWQHLIKCKHLLAFQHFIPNTSNRF